jgi:flagellar hook capping protein FlgD
MRTALGRLFQVTLIIAIAVSLHSVRRLVAEDDEVEQPQLLIDAPNHVLGGTPVRASATATIRFDELARQSEIARQQALSSGKPIRLSPWAPNEYEAPPEPYFPPAPSAPKFNLPLSPMVASPSPVTSFQGLDDVPMADSSYIVIPPDIGGAVGLTKVMEAFNNNYRIRDKATGATISTVGTATFWSAVVAPSERLSLTDPRTVYDPYNNRWIAVMQTVTSNAGKLLLSVSQTSDPSGAWYQYSYDTGARLDFPIIGFNKNWISISINRYSIAGAFQRGINLVVNYPQARVGTFQATLFTMAANTGFCTAPSVTYSTTQDTLFLVTHLSSAGATYQVDRITGTAAAPAYTAAVGGALTRPGGGWVQPSGNQLPQSAPNVGSSACGATPCPMEIQDAQVRSAPVYRGGKLYYTQTIGLPTSGMTHSAVQWTKLNATTGAFMDGGRIDDPTATSTNGGKWYAYPHIAVNGVGDFLIGYTQCSSIQHPSAGYSMHYAADAAGTVRDPFVYKVGEDYYHKTFSTATGRNRWGDFSTAQVDPSDDTKMWVLQEYAKTRISSDDGGTGSNGSRWSSWWASVTNVPTFTITATVGSNGSMSPGTAGAAQGSNLTETITPNNCYHVNDVLVDGVSVGAVTSYTFTNVQADHTIDATFALNGPYTITASAGPGGTILPSGNIVANCGGTRTFSITAASGFSILDVLVDNVSQGAVSGYAFTNIQANHTISATFQDNASPVVHVNSPNGGESLAVGTTPLLTWTATDNAAVTCVDLLLSRNGAGGPFDTLATCMPDSGDFAWHVIGPLTTHAIFRVVAHDAALHTGVDNSDAEFTIYSAQTAVSETPSVTRFALMATSANPVRGAAGLMLLMPEAGHVRVAVYDVNGREVAVLADEAFGAGRHPMTWNTNADGRRAPAGVYFVRATGLGKKLVERVTVTH